MKKLEYDDRRRTETTSVGPERGQRPCIDVRGLNPGNDQGEGPSIKGSTDVPLKE